MKALEGSGGKHRSQGGHFDRMVCAILGVNPGGHERRGGALTQPLGVRGGPQGRCPDPSVEAKGS